jgi:hypothetical protein
MRRVARVYRDIPGIAVAQLFARGVTGARETLNHAGQGRPLICAHFSITPSIRLFLLLAVPSSFFRFRTPRRFLRAHAPVLVSSQATLFLLLDGAFSFAVSFRAQPACAPSSHRRHSAHTGALVARDPGLALVGCSPARAAYRLRDPGEGRQQAPARVKPSGPEYVKSARQRDAFVALSDQCDALTYLHLLPCEARS